ncbi:MAG: glycosyltransferase family 4 protein [bacterium]
MKIAQIAPPWWTIPPKGYGGIERVVALLTEGLVERGHEVTLIAPSGSETRATFLPSMEPMHNYLGSVAVETENTLFAYQAADRFDVIHDHTVAGLTVSPFVRKPVVHTVHGAVLDDIRGLYSNLPPNVHLVAISGSQRLDIPTSACTTIYNAVAVEEHPWCEQAGEYLLFVGRAAPQKGPMEAIRIAERAGRRLVMLLKVNETAEHEYFEFLKPHLIRNHVQLELEVTERRKQAYMAGAFATLFPISWEEPFGLVMIESMVAGTPVIGFRRGSVSEIVEHGVTGFVCDDVESAAEAVAKVKELSRRSCRERVERLFSARGAIERHEALYRDLVEAHAYD